MHQTPIPRWIAGALAAEPAAMVHLVLVEHFPVVRTIRRPLAQAEVGDLLRFVEVFVLDVEDGRSAPSREPHIPGGRLEADVAVPPVGVHAVVLVIVGPCAIAMR